MLTSFEKFMLLVASYLGTLPWSDWTVLQEARTLKGKFKEPEPKEDQEIHPTLQPLLKLSKPKEPTIDPEQRAWEFFEYQVLSHDCSVEIPRPEWMR